MKRISVLVALALAQPVFAADLMQIYQDAKSQDSTIASARAAYQAGQERVPQGRAALLPQVNLGANINHTTLERTGLATGSGNPYGYTLSLSQPLYRPQNWATYDQAKQQVLQSEAQFSAAQQDLILREIGRAHV